uniref:Uncharacterized protein n=1 Tax=Timema monikensis TaxID=170555 RepID=A0A7R9DWY4_9NEOP|nr:unnamed protein product [Timema monikensis]
MVKSKKIVIAKQFDGEPKESDFEIIEEELPPLKDGGKWYIRNMLDTWAPLLLVRFQSSEVGVILDYCPFHVIQPWGRMENDSHPWMP